MTNIVGLDGNDDLLNVTGDEDLFGLAGNDTLTQNGNSGTTVSLVGGSGNDRYLFKFNGETLILENGDDADDRLIEIPTLGAGAGRIYQLESRHLVFENFFGDRLIVIDWERPENRIERWELDGQVMTYAEIRNAVLTSESYEGNLSFAQAGFSLSEAINLAGAIDSLYTRAADLEAGVVNVPITRFGTSDGETLTGGPEDDDLQGNGGDDILIGGEGDDRLNGGEGFDVLTGGPGNDIYFITPNSGGSLISDALDTINEVDGEGSDTLVTSVDFDASDISLEAVLATGSSDVDLITNDDNNIVVGNNADNVFITGGGNDLLIGARGDDVLLGGIGYDVYSFGSFWRDDEIRDGHGFSIVDFSESSVSSLSASANGRDLLISSLNGDTLAIRGYYEDPSQYAFVDSSDAYVTLDTPDDSILYSRFVGLNTSLSGSVGGAGDSSDFYQFKPAAAGTITVNVTGLSSTVSVFLYDESGSVMQAATASPGSGGGIDFDAMGGQRYYVELRSSALSTNYEVSLEADYGSGNTLAGAIPVTENVRIDFAEVGGSGDQYDYYSYTAAEDGEISILLNMLDDNIDLILYDEDGITISSSRNDGDTAENISLDVSAGEQFFIGIVPNGNVSSPYSLLVNETGEGESNGETGGDAGATLAFASHVATNFEVLQSVGFGADADDLFQVSPDSDGLATFTLSGLSQDLTLHLYSESGVRITTSQTSGVGDESLQVSLQADQTYYVGVTPATGGEETEYRLTGSFVSTGPEPGNSFETALEIDLSSPFEISESVGLGGDSDDLYVFTAPETGDVSISLTGFETNLDLHVYTPSGVRIASSRNGGAQSESLTLSVEEGTEYYVGATPATSQGSEYDLSLAYSSSSSSASTQGPQVVSNLEI